MHHEVVCPGGHRVRVTEEHFGQQVKCPTCNQVFVVPEVPTVDPDKAAAPKVDTGGAVSRLKNRWKTNPPSLDGLTLAAGRPMLAVGLLLVLVSRGCDTVGQRGVSRVRAKATLAKAQFDDEWEDEENKLQKELEDLAAKDEPEPSDSKRRSDLLEQISKHQENKRKARQDNERGEWRYLDQAARDAASEHDMNGYWRAIFFVFASMMLATGLLVCSWNGDGPERWVCLIMLAIITFSIYIGGVAWIALPNIGM